MSTISRKNQVTLPVDVLRDAGLEPGDDLRITSVGPGRIEMIKTDELIKEFAGSIAAGVYPPGYLEDARHGWA